jgi:hypothetical protein
MRPHQKALIGVLAGLALSIVFTDSAHAQGRVAVGLESDFDTASLLWRVRGPISLGARFAISKVSPAPMLRYNVTNLRGIRLFFHAEAGGFGGGGKGGKGKKGGGGRGLGGIDLGLGGEYIVMRRMSVFGVVSSGGNFLGLQYYF